MVGARSAKQADGVMNAGTLRLTSQEKSGNRSAERSDRLTGTVDDSAMFEQ